MSCSYKSVTLAAGESFVLPPGATVVGATDPNVITSVNNCTDLTNLETPQCYSITYSISVGNAAVFNSYGAYEDVVFTAFAYGSTIINFPADITVAGSSGADPGDPINITIAQKIATYLITLSGGVITNAVASFISSVGDRRVFKIVFDTIPSVGNDFHFIARAVGFDVNNLEDIHIYAIPCPSA